MSKVQTLLAGSAPIMADGAMGTMLFEAGLPSGDAPQSWNLLHPDSVRAVHRAYLEAGSQILLSNTFGGNCYRLSRHNLEDRIAEVNRAGAELLRAEVEASGGRALVAGDIGPTGELFAPLGKLTFADAMAAFAEQAAGLIAGGVDLIWIETMSDLKEIHAAVEGVRRMSAEIPLMVTMTFERHGRTMMGVSAQQAAESLTGWGVCAFGGNCGTGPEELLPVLRSLHACAPDIPLIFKPNAGMPELIDGRTVYNATPESMGAVAPAAVAAGARILGGCCGSAPAHLQSMARALRAG